MDHVIPLIYDVTQRNWVTSVGGSVVQDPIEIGQMQSITFKVKFVKDGVQYALTTPAFSGGIKALNAVGAGYLLQFSTPTVTGSGPTTVYEFELLIDSSQLRAFIASYLPSYLGFSYALEIRDSFNNIATLPALSTKIYPDYTIVGTSPTTAVGTWNIAAGQTFTVNKTFAMPLDDGTAGFVLRTDGAGVGTWVANTLGSVTSVGQTFTGGIVSVSGSPVTSSGTFALTVAGTSGGIPYFSSGTTWATSAVLLANSLVKGGGAGNPPSTITTGTGVLTALGNTTNAAGGIVTFSGNVGATTATTVNGNTITAGTGTLTLGVNTINLAVGTGVGSILGGSINLSGGTGVSSSYSANSGSINLSGGTSDLTGDAYGGSINLSGGVGGDNYGGSINLSGGTDVSPYGGNHGGSINLSGGASTHPVNGNNYGGSINLSGGAGGYNNNGGSIDLSGSLLNNDSYGGSINCSSNSDGGKGGSIDLRSASGAFGSSGGSIDLSATGASNGGSINLSNGGGSITTTAGGSITTGTGSLTGPVASGTIAITADKLSAFASTTSAELAGVISDKTGTGKLIFSAGTFTSTASQTYTFPTTSTTVAGLSIAQTFTANQAFSGTISLVATTATAGKIIQAGNNLLHTFGTENLFLGLNAGNTTSTGQYSVGVGTRTMASLTTGRQNLCFGWQAGYFITTGWDNMIFGGYNTGHGISTGSGNTIIGANADATNGNYRGAIGAGASCTADDTIVIGKAAGTYSVAGTPGSRSADAVIIRGALTVSGGATIASGQALKLGNVATTGLSPGVLAATTNASITITDSNGTVYRIPCIV